MTTKPQRKSYSDSPGTEAFERGQKRAAPIAILVGVIAAILIEGASLIVLPLLLLVGVLYWLIVYGGARLLSRYGLRIWQRHKDR